METSHQPLDRELLAEGMKNVSIGRLIPWN
jgi:hypothetical protein